MYDRASTADARAKLRAWLVKYRPEKPLKGAISLSIVWNFKSKELKNYCYRTSKPDLDNLNKLLQDIMQELKFYNDDSQIVHLLAYKFSGPNGSIYVHLEEIEEQRNEIA